MNKRKLAMAILLIVTGAITIKAQGAIKDIQGLEISDTNSSTIVDSLVIADNIYGKAEAIAEANVVSGIEPHQSEFIGIMDIRVRSSAYITPSIANRIAVEIANRAIYDIAETAISQIVMIEVSNAQIIEDLG